MGREHGRYSVRFRADLPGYGAAMLWWPDSDVWAEGETDYPEDPCSSGISGCTHRVGSRMGENSLVVDAATAGRTGTSRRSSWTPVALEFYMDGQLVGTDTSNASQASRHWDIRTAEHGDPAGSWVTGNLQIDWIALWEYTG